VSKNNSQTSAIKTTKIGIFNYIILILYVYDKFFDAEKFFPYLFAIEYIIICSTNTD
jgi:hypothetical protein